MAIETYAIQCTEKKINKSLHLAIKVWVLDRKRKEKGESLIFSIAHKKNKQ